MSNSASSSFHAVTSRAGREHPADIAGEEQQREVAIGASLRSGLPRGEFRDLAAPCLAAFGEGRGERCQCQLVGWWLDDPPAQQTGHGGADLVPDVRCPRAGLRRAAERGS
jgi:hypothetical protein